MKPVLLALVVLFAAPAFSKPDAKTLSFAKKYDIADILKPKHKILGFIEPKYKRLLIDFDSFKKSPTNPLIYLVVGSTTVGNNTCKFKGQIAIETVAKVPMHYGVDDEFKKNGVLEEGEITGLYEFKEEKVPKVCGIFTGKMTLAYYISRDDIVVYDDIDGDSDRYKNNQYRGVWTAYESKTSKIANWGEFRVPDSGDLDIGAGDFAPNPKYKAMGWDDFN